MVFRFVSSIVTMALRPTSLPVPAVVGMAIMLGIGPLILAPPPLASPYWASGSGWLVARRTSLATSIGAPPPSATIRFAPESV